MPEREGVRHDFWVFWAGQTVSNLGNAITFLALPLLIFHLTGSALNLAIASATAFLPYPLFGLVIGAWVDRVDRRRLMIATDLARAAMLCSIPLFFELGDLAIWWIYAVGFINSTLGIAFNASEFAAIPSLVDRGDLVSANGRIQASYSAATIAGPLVAGVLFAVVAPATVLLLDAATFAISAVSLVLVRTNLNAAAPEEPTSLAAIRRDVVEGLRYVLGHPVLRAISLMMALVNFVGASTGAQLVFFAKERFSASDGQVSLLYSAAGAGVVLFSLSAGLLRRRWSFSRVALGALMLNGLLTLAFALVPGYWPALGVWALLSGAGVLFNINTGTLRQTIVPNQLLGRVQSIAGVLAWSAIPLGSFLGGLAIEWSGSVALIYALIGLAVAAIAAAFAFTALGHAEDYLPPEQAGSQPEPVEVGVQ
ncbi:MAG TPA: MFS transporter [Thermomicrobiaceae bacterium]|nr:MFS transporter [Thermomicrobiaceae bacterium]